MHVERVKYNMSKYGNVILIPEQAGHLNHDSLPIPISPDFHNRQFPRAHS